MTFDYCVVGAGIVGLAVATELLRREPGARVVVLEKEPAAAVHQTGHNSGVIHSGIYYQPDSLKARLCREGAEATKQFCRDNAIAFDQCGKLLVATNALELERMDVLAKRAAQNDIAFKYLDAQQLQNTESRISGLGALLVPSTGIVNYRTVGEAMAGAIQAKGGVIRLGANVSALREEDTGVVIEAGGDRIEARRLIACAGLQSDRLARLAGLKIKHRIVPFRGEYHVLPPRLSNIVKHLIYPIPDPDLPFLGIHLTRMIDGSLTVGPNAVLGFDREGYPKGRMRGADIADMMGFAGFWKLIAANWRSGLLEFGNSLFKRRYLEACRKYCPELEAGDLQPWPAGIRAQAVMQDGTLVHDFLFVQSERMLHVCNAPSPAATSAIPIGKMIVDKVLAG
ncbi:hydroxyglutarate oxidase [Mesorhizobium sp. Root157]|uniref:L-2-hydroxyglutarate oxidase n=1 Tax=Mesorhizobium sp. Root157 TaxID=1736477 RepID=UPI000701D029|nr:L-2-hydroxyglutarate oxidase [Mesorhizobium sp. Root157]KQZ78158.1 hydroxyglutarate oxidase [Mesorhizobium sp. Root157]